MSGPDANHAPWYRTDSEVLKLRDSKRKRSGSSPTQRTLAEMRARGYELVDVVERWLPWVRQRKDLFGIGDVMAVGTPGVCIVQTTSGSNLSSRVKKLSDSAALPHLRTAGIKIFVHGWRKNAKGRFVLREVDLS